MKRISLLTFALFLAYSLSAQKSIDRLFARYSGNDGFVSVSFSGNLLNLLKCEEDDDDHLPENITEFRILAQDEDDHSVSNFYDLVRSELDTKEYDEYMSVKKSGQDIKMYVKANDRVISEFLLIGGGKDNFVIQIKGKITFEEADEFSADIRKNDCRKVLSGHN